MITDERRREIVGNLRYCAEMCHSTGVLDSDVLNALDIHCGDADGVSSAYDVEKLADLIDRPTCHISETDHEFEDSVRCDRCRTTFNRPWEPFKYCPNCGAEVVGDARI
ncbi:hypothetical protein ACQRAJ_07770 [Collinsella sp. SGI.184]|uniref:hypothetical protein n=1 Tax=Collinsella sp. SGI.184 TaxID=3420556 RepID=UPI003D05E3A0